LCNEGYSVTFKIDGVTIFNIIGKEILKGNRDWDTGLCRINLCKEIPHNPIAPANNVYELRSTRALVNYLHKEMFSPSKAELIKAIKQGHLTTWPGLTEDEINNLLKLTPATAMGHMNQKKAKYTFHKQGDIHNFRFGGYNSDTSGQWRQNTTLI
jgi:hypothetical protein